jgi:hypothetical protein
VWRGPWGVARRASICALVEDVQTLHFSTPSLSPPPTLSLSNIKSTIKNIVRGYKSGPASESKQSANSTLSNAPALLRSSSHFDVPERKWRRKKRLNTTRKRMKEIYQYNSMTLRQLKRIRGCTGPSSLRLRIAWRKCVRVRALPPPHSHCYLLLSPCPIFTNVVNI